MTLYAACYWTMHHAHTLSIKATLLPHMPEAALPLPCVMCSTMRRRRCQQAISGCMQWSDALANNSIADIAAVSTSMRFLRITGSASHIHGEHSRVMQQPAAFNSVAGRKNIVCFCMLLLLVTKSLWQTDVMPQSSILLSRPWFSKCFIKTPKHLPARQGRLAHATYPCFVRYSAGEWLEKMILLR